MAEVVGLVASALTIAGVAASAIQLSQALFAVAQTLKHAPREIADIAEQIRSLSTSLVTLDEYVMAHEDDFKPALFENTKSILSQYFFIDQELRELTGDSKKLLRLGWFMKRPKAKSLLKRVESIKTALSLELNLVQLTRETMARSKAIQSNERQSLTRPCRFRKLVEIAVQANRQVVQSAQKTDPEDKMWEARPIGKALGLWKDGSFDTATWLYHLVFSPQVPPYPPHSSASPYQASVSEENNDYTVELSRPNSDPYSEYGRNELADMTMIVWGAQTEPSLVVDRLLSDWTRLTPEQIKQSSTHREGDHWAEAFDKMLGEARQEEDVAAAEEERPTSQVDDWTYQGSGNISTRSSDVETSDDNSESTVTHHSNPSSPSQSIPLPSPVGPEFNRPLERSDTDDNLESDRSDNVKDRYADTAKNAARRAGTRKLPSSPRRSTARQVHFKEKERTTRNPWTAKHTRQQSPTRDTQTRLRSHASAQSAAWTAKSVSGSPYSHNAPSYNPFTPMSGLDDQPYSVPQHPFAAASHGSGGSQPQSQQNSPPFIYPSAPMPNVAWTASSPIPSAGRGAYRADPQTQSDSPIAQREDVVIAAIEKLLAKPSSEQIEPETSRLTSLIQLVIAQQTSQADSDQAQANAVMEVELMHVKAAREKDFEKITKLEDLIRGQREEQRLLEITWKAEQSSSKDVAAQQFQVAKEVAERELTAAYVIKKSAKKSMKFAKAQAEKKAEEQRQNQVKKHQRRIEEDQRQRLNRIEDLVHIRNDNINQNPNAAGPYPMRRTCIRDGDRSVEVAEFTTEQLEPLVHSPIAPFNFFRDETISQYGTSKLGQTQSRVRPSLTPVASIYSLDTSSNHTRAPGSLNSGQSTIVLSSNVDRTSLKTKLLQDTLANSGVKAVFEELAPSGHSQLISYKRNSDFTTRSTLFWEAPTLGLRSELLSTMKQAGWKPFYVRTSESGQTFFYGEQPIHTYIFQPDHEPQFTALLKASSLHSIVINTAFIEDAAMEELGLHYRSENSGVYILDGRLTHSDIEDLVERSFSIRETRFRKEHRRLAWQQETDEDSDDTATEKSLAASLHSSTSGYAYDRRTTYTEPQSQPQTPINASSRYLRCGDAERYLDPTRDNDDVPSLRSSSPSTASPSVASWSSKSSTNPYRQYMSASKVESVQGRSPPDVVQNFWDDPMLH